MLWLKRGCWLIAWCVWAALGVGLYRELPRRIGPAVRQIVLEQRECVIGFLPDSTLIATSLWNRDNLKTTFSVYDAHSAERIHRLQGPVVLPSNWGPQRVGFERRAVRRKGVVAVDLVPVGGDESSSRKLHLLDLKTGNRRCISEETAAAGELHEERPWVLIREPIGPGYALHRYRVFDYEKNVDRFMQLSPFLGVCIGNVFFIPNVDQLVVVAYASEKRLDWKTATSAWIWSLAETPPRILKTTELPPMGYGSAVASANRVAFAGMRNNIDSTLDVADLTDGRLLGRFGGWKPHYSQPTAMAQPPLTISRDGKTVLGGTPAALWEVDAQRMLWRGADGEAADVDAERGEFAVREQWTHRMPPALQFGGRIHDFATVAWRSLQTGRVLRRTWASEFVEPDMMSSDRTLGVAADGTIYRMPYRVDRLVLALCQAVLATPMMLAWLVIRRRARHHRRLR